MVLDTVISLSGKVQQGSSFSHNVRVTLKKIGQSLEQFLLSPCSRNAIQKPRGDETRVIVVVKRRKVE